MSLKLRSGKEIATGSTSTPCKQVPADISDEFDSFTEDNTTLGLNRTESVDVLNQMDKEVLDFDVAPQALNFNPVLTGATYSQTEAFLTKIETEQLNNRLDSVTKRNGELSAENTELKSQLVHVFEMLNNLQKLVDNQEKEMAQSHLTLGLLQDELSVVNKNNNCCCQCQHLMGRLKTLEDLVTKLTSGSQTPTHKTKPVTVNKRKKKSKVLILSDSQGKQLSGLLSKQLPPDCEVYSYIRPGCTAAEVARDVDKLIEREQLDEDDHLIYIAGSNDVTSGSAAVGNFTSAVSKVVSQSRRTNIIVSQVPVRYDLPNRFKSVVSDFNKIVNSRTRRTSAQTLTLDNLPRRYMTKHGLHYSDKGRQFISEALSQLILNVHFLEKSKNNTCQT